MQVEAQGAFGGIGIFGKLAYGEGSTVGTLLSVRFVVAAVLLWGLTAATGALAGLRRLATLGPLSVVLSQEPDLRSALTLLCRYWHSYNEALRMRLDEDGDLATMRLWFEFGEPAPTRQATELATAALLGIVRELLGESIIITSNGAGTVKAFYNVCRHRGTKLCTEATGAFAGTIVSVCFLKSNRIRCEWSESRPRMPSAPIFPASSRAASTFLTCFADMSSTGTFAVPTSETPAMLWSKVDERP